MTMAMTIDAECDGGSLERLQAGIDARSQALKVCTGDSIVAAGITILRSLRAATAQAPNGKKPKVDPCAYRIVETNMYGGFYVPKGNMITHKLGGKFPNGGRRAILTSGVKICARIGSHAGPMANIRPAIGFKPESGKVIGSRVYAIYTDNPNDRFEKNVNSPALCWYVLCEHIGQAVAYAENHIRRIYRKESGMARYAIAIAQAAASTRDDMLPKEAATKNGTMSQRAASIAHSSAEIEVLTDGADEGVASVTFFDGLNYSKSAAGGDGAVAAAIDKAANAMVNAYGTPEVKEIFTKYDIADPERALYQAFRAHWIARNSGSDKLKKRTPF